MPELHINDGVASRKAKELHFHDGAAARKAKEVWYHDGTAARKVFSGFAISPGASFGVDAGGGSPSIKFYSDGSGATFDGITNPFNWGTPTSAGAGAAYWIKFTPGTGSGTLYGSTTGVWIQLSMEPALAMTAAPTKQARYKNVTYQIASDSGGATVVASGSIAFTSDNSFV